MTDQNGLGSSDTKVKKAAIVFNIKALVGAVSKTIRMNKTVQTVKIINT